MLDKYTEIKEAVERAGYHTGLLPDGLGNLLLVLVPRRAEAPLRDKCVRLCLQRGRWYLVTSLPTFYRVPSTADVLALCIDCLHALDRMATIPADIMVQYQLTEINQDDYLDAKTTRHRWRWFVAIEVSLMIATIAGTWAAAHFDARWTVIPFTALWTWLGLTLPIVFLYLIGRPPVMTLPPSRESRAFRRALNARPIISDDEFHSRYYADSAISQEVCAAVRRCVLCFDGMGDRIVPADDVQLLNDELDLGWVLECVAKHFGVQFTRADYRAVDGTLDNLIQLVHTKVAEVGRAGTR